MKIHYVLFAILTCCFPLSTTVLASAPAPEYNVDSCTAVINSNLDIHIPAANYQSTSGPTNIWVNLVFEGPNAAGTYIWKLYEYGANQSDCSSLSLTEVSSSLAIDIPLASYQSAERSSDIWVKLAYRGQDAAGEHLWGLQEYGAHEQDNNGPYDITQYMIFPPESIWNYTAYDSDGRFSENFSTIVEGPVSLNGGATAYLHSYYQDTIREDTSLLGFDINNFYYHGEQIFVADDEMPAGIYQAVPPVTIPRNVQVGDHFTNISLIAVPFGMPLNLVWEVNVLEHLNHYSLAGTSYSDCLRFEFIETTIIETSHDMIWVCRDVGQVKWLDVIDGYYDELQSYSIAE